ncbi:hypothetical protein ES703_51066 [subsurface metagenome]
MAANTNGRQITMMIGLLLGAIAIALSAWARDLNNPETIMSWLGLISVAVFLLFVLYFIVSSFLSLFKIELPLAGIPSAFVVYLGLLFFAFSFHPNIMTELLKLWNVGLAALGLALLSLGIALWKRD